ncbi:MAG: MarP family serine protease [Candidatus Saccharimonadales bacterium]
MNLLDLIIIVFLAGALFRGLQSGFVQQFFSTLGFIAGIFLGAWLQGYLIGLVDSAQAKSLMSLVVILSSAIILMTLGEFIGMRLKNKFSRVGIIQQADRVFGSALAMVLILAAVWLGAAMFNKVPVVGLQQQIRGSRIVATLNGVLPSAPNVISQIGHFISPNSFPQVFSGLEPKLQTDAPLPDLGELRSAVEHARASVVKVTGEGCGGIVEGSGFVAGDGLVITNAHVVAGVTNLSVVDTAGGHSAQAVWFDPNLDLAILRTGGLAGKPLALNSARVDIGTKAVATGYPSGGGFTASPAVVLETINARGRDIYNQHTTVRSVHSVKADIQQGNSGGPLLAADGSVIGVLFAESTTYPDVGYSLTMNPVIESLDKAKNSSPTPTGACAQ